MTRADVAKLAGTSVAVVSYVVNNGPRPVSIETRERVLAAILETNYRSNSIARALAAGATLTYGLVVPDISNPFFAALAHALEDEVFASGRVLLLGDSAGIKARETEIVDLFLQRQVDGILYVPTDSQPDLRTATASHTPVVVLDRLTDNNLASSVAIDNVAAADIVTQHLIDHGYTDIGSINGPPALSTSVDRYFGWKRRMQIAGLTIHDDWSETSEFTKQAGYIAARRIISSQPRPPRAIFAANEQQAIGVLRAAAELGVSVPDDLALVTIDGTETAKFSIPPLTGIYQPIDDIAKHALKLLSSAQSSPNERILCRFELVIGSSCGCIPAVDSED